MKKLLVTGGAGFIGSNFIQYILKLQQSLALLINLDLLTCAGTQESLAAVWGARYRFVSGGRLESGSGEKTVPGI